MRSQIIPKFSGYTRAVGRYCVALTAIFLLLTTCSSDEVTYKERSVEEIYNQAMGRLLSGDSQLAAIDFDEVERQHPYSVWARKSQLMCALGKTLV